MEKESSNYSTGNVVNNAEMNFGAVRMSECEETTASLLSRQRVVKR